MSSQQMPLVEAFTDVASCIATFWMRLKAYAGVRHSSYYFVPPSVGDIIKSTARFYEGIDVAVKEERRRKDGGGGTIWSYLRNASRRDIKWLGVG